MKEFPPFRLDPANQCLWRSTEIGGEQRVPLKPKAFEVLRYLVEHAGRLVTQEELLGAVWPDTFVQSEALKRHIFDIRSELGDDPKNPRFIETLPRRGYQFIAVARDPVPVKSRGGCTPAKIVGRAAELAQLQSCLLKSATGRRQIVFVTGEMGIGKSALVDALQREPSPNFVVRVARGQCLEVNGGNEAYYPVLEALGNLCRGPESENTVEILAARAPTWLVQFPSLLRRQQRDALDREISGATRQRMLREMGDALELITTATPLLLILEDLHWVDASTVDLISALARGRTRAKLMLVATFRSGHPALFDHPLARLKQDLLVRQLCHELILGPLSEADIAAYLLDESPDGVAKDLVDLLHRYSEGNPLFLEAALQHLTSRGFVSREGGGWKLNRPIKEIAVEVPENLQTILETQFDHLDAEHRRALEVASVVGNPFCATLSSTAADMDQEVFEQCCERLSRVCQVVRPSGTRMFPDGTTSHTYAFVHAVHREALYRRQSSGRRTNLHKRIGELLERRFVHALSEVAPALAQHFERGGDWSRAVKYLRLSAELAVSRGMYGEATATLHRALELIGRMPEPERGTAEIAIQEQLAHTCALSGDAGATETKSPA